MGKGVKSSRKSAAARPKAKRPKRSAPKKPTKPSGPKVARKPASPASPEDLKKRFEEFKKRKEEAKPESKPKGKGGKAGVEARQQGKPKAEAKEKAGEEVKPFSPKKLKESDLKAQVDKLKEEGPEEAEPEEKKEEEKILENLDKYDFFSNKMPITIFVYRKEGEFVPVYKVQISSISPTTEILLERIRKELIRRVNLGMMEITDFKKKDAVEERFRETIGDMIDRYFPDIDDDTKGFLTTYLIQKSLGLGNIEILMDDPQLEEIVINSASEPVWVYHKKHGWLKTNLMMNEESQTKHYATMIARKVGRQITVLEPLLDAHLGEGDRVNATLIPISTRGNTMTIRKFSRDPWTITRFLKSRTMSPESAALVWTAMQFELSAIIAGGTASGKTSTLNVLANFFPPNQRIISIEDTREIRLPKFLHWVPMSTRLPNSEGKGEISMEDLLVNALRQRPDRILVGEVRRKREAETLFEAIHTGHSVYATFHANNVQEAIDRLTNPPIDVPKTMLPAISMILIQFRNRRTGIRRAFQIAEILPDASPNLLMQYDGKKDVLENVNKSKSLLSTLRLYTGYSEGELSKLLAEKVKILKWMVKHDIQSIDAVGRVMAEFYTNPDHLMSYVNKNKKFVE